MGFRTGASLVVQLMKNLPAMPETWVQFLGQEDPLEKGMARVFSSEWPLRKELELQFQHPSFQ